MKNFFFIIITLFSSFKLLISNCIPNQNCLKERGECIDNICVCYDEFWTLKPNKENNLPNIFCNYEKRSRFLPLILEFFLPGIGHIVMKKYLLGIIKIILWATMTILFYTDFQNHKNENIEENNKNIPKNEEQFKLINNDNNKNLNLNIVQKKDLKNKESEELNFCSFSDDLDDNANLAKPYTANHEKILIPLKQKILTGIAIFCLIGFFILYIFDLFAYGFAFYKDSNNVSFL